MCWNKSLPKIEKSSAFLYSKLSTDLSQKTQDFIEVYQDEMLVLTDFLKNIKSFILTRDEDLTIKGEIAEFYT